MLEELERIIPEDLTFKSDIHAMRVNWHKGIKEINTFITKFSSCLQISEAKEESSLQKTEINKKSSSSPAFFTDAKISNLPRSEALTASPLQP